VGPRTGLDDVEKRKFLTLHGLELRPLCRPTRSQSLYRLSSLGSLRNEFVTEMKYDVNTGYCCLGVSFCGEGRRGNMLGERFILNMHGPEFAFGLLLAAWQRERYG
jgi:hypothetical protein